MYSANSMEEATLPRIENLKYGKSGKQVDHVRKSQLKTQGHKSYISKSHFLLATLGGI